MTLRDKIFNLFDHYIPDGSTMEAAYKELSRSGKLDVAKLTRVVFVLMEEIEEMKTKIK